MIIVELNKQVVFVYPKKLVEKINKIVQKKLSLKGNFNLSLAIVSPAKIRQFNRIYRKKDYVTDVLSFEDNDKINKAIFIGEILICLVQAKKQAKEKKHSVQQEFITLYLHGLLHLFGYDHLKKAEAEMMETLEQKILNQIY
ncbi:rRNA maturation RNase YbeY [Candidatus Falkowbacteria bacterium RIFOXYD2_FULL_35_9]|uniref:Endoribonuclease YbeY n=1 Tax=Candidatus Falkowbacteria bacterium RIFOXYC2_FULL_36_12 TaxID=1798002 RepID=A0A1F5SYS2_9BACT|nr:MAG: rRNA maturation RNase YbeY [Candidatus Falkowbacteria bacterium RIFOXYB2_FULL_35_7]OGF31875.1 MAG: rRNA maturation RNase YbeY [Candidatus Falkowbacteria bacterium RIFOXYC2_FULL_36_12]OGF33986.1 MAG: rRNA maturation RNase YbeY [Candidatus Falkowbacteria bacterium RIFOXYA2_FULL_35_8]OGF45821.1 MAG: rRNA maturation RNase YbeY [Candidatus Falkowbacteria bacterium RIFOXYD2_FULL_35_9]